MHLHLVRTKIVLVGLIGVNLSVCRFRNRTKKALLLNLV